MTDPNNTQATQQPPTPYPALKSLDRLVGTWKIFGPEIQGQDKGKFSDDDNTLAGRWVWPGGGYESTATRAK